MRRTLGALAFAAIFLPSVGFACDAFLDPIRIEIRSTYRIELTCEKLEAAAEVLPVTGIAPIEGVWSYTGELQIRDDLWKRYRIHFSTAVMPLGVIDRQPTEGKGFLLVFGLEMPRRAWGLLALAQHEGKVTTEGAAAILGEGALYDWVGFYGKDAQGKVDPNGDWIKLEAGGSWSEKRPAPVGEARACLPCEGWLCGKDPIACFSDFNVNRREETLLIDDCQPYACGLRVLEPNAKGRMTVLFNEPGMYGEWTRRPESWVLVAEVFCPWGEFCGEGEASLGNPNCERPEVYRFDAGSGRLKADADLKNEYYPIENRRAPGGCRVESEDGVIVYTKDKKFVRFLP